MKLSPREADGYFAKPDAGKTGLLIYGADAMRVALKRHACGSRRSIDSFGLEGGSGRHPYSLQRAFRMVHQR